MSRLSSQRAISSTLGVTGLPFLRMSSSIFVPAPFFLGACCAAPAPAQQMAKDHASRREEVNDSSKLVELGQGRILWAQILA